MYEFQENKSLPYSASEMYALVNDVASYPEFLPACERVDMHHVTVNEMQASMHFAKKGLRYQLTTVNTLTLNKKIEMRLQKGPFKHFYGEWIFDEDSAGGTRVGLRLEFALASGFLERLAGSLLQTASEKLVGVFCRRAREVYGERS